MKNRFLAKFKKSSITACWEWTAGKDFFGYGRFNFHGSNVHAHRVSWILHKGKIKSDFCVLHKCDNPGCVNPSHLFLGTRADNVADMIRKKRDVPNKGEKNGRSKLTTARVKSIRKEYRTLGTHQWRLGQRYGVSQPVISKVVRNERWIV